MGRENSRAALDGGTLMLRYADVILCLHYYTMWGPLSPLSLHRTNAFTHNLGTHRTYSANARMQAVRGWAKKRVGFLLRRISSALFCTGAGSCDLRGRSHFPSMSWNFLARPHIWLTLVMLALSRGATRDGFREAPPPVSAICFRLLFLANARAANQ